MNEIRKRGRKEGPCIAARKIKDPTKYPHFRSYGQTKNQAKFRGEPFELTFDEYLEIWDWKIQYRGRTKDSFCLTRKDSSKAWNKENTIVVYRNNGMNHDI